MSSTGTSARSLASSFSRGYRARREHRRNQVVIRESRKGDGIESLPLLRVGIVDVDVQRVALGVDARRRHRNQATLMEEDATVNDQIANAPLGRIDNHSIERSEFHCSLGPHIKRLHKQRFEL